jgi:hypothetical protein
MTDLTKQEQAHVRTALVRLKLQCGGWNPVAKILRLNPATLSGVATGKLVTPVMAFRVARFVKMGVEELLAGKFTPPGTCPHCGKSISE